MAVLTPVSQSTHRLLPERYLDDCMSFVGGFVSQCVEDAGIEGPGSLPSVAMLPLHELWKLTRDSNLYLDARLQVQACLEQVVKHREFSGSEGCIRFVSRPQRRRASQ